MGRIPNAPTGSKKMLLHNIVVESDLYETDDLYQTEVERVMIEWTDPVDGTDHLLRIEGIEMRFATQTRDTHYPKTLLGSGKTEVVEKIVEVEKPRTTPEIGSVVVWTYDGKGYIANKTTLTSEDIGLEIAIGNTVVELKEAKEAKE